MLDLFGWSIYLPAPFLFRYTPSPQLELSGPADFGVTVADGKVLSCDVVISNEGSSSGEFKIRYSGNQPITIMPSGGIVKPGGKQTIKVFYFTVHSQGLLVFFFAPNFFMFHSIKMSGHCEHNSF